MITTTGRLSFCTLLALYFLHGLHQPASAQSLSFALLADRSTGSIHKLNLVDYSDAVVADGLGALRGTALAGHSLFAFNDDEQLYRLVFDKGWNLTELELPGSLASAASFSGNAIYVEGKNLYSAGPCGVARFRLHAGALAMVGIVATVNVTSFAAGPNGTLFLLGTSDGAIYKVSRTNGKRDWSTLRSYKRLQIDRAGAIATDPQGDILVAVASHRLITSGSECAEISTQAMSSAVREIPEGVSAIVRVKSGTKHEHVFWYGLPLNFDPPTQGVIGLAVSSKVVAVISKRTPAAGSNLLLFSPDGGSYAFWTSQDELVSVALGGLHNNGLFPQGQPDFSISCNPPEAAISPGASAEYTVVVNPTNDWSNAVQLSLSGLPAQATAAFSPDPIPVGSTASALTISNTAAVPAGKYKLTIKARVITRNPTASSHRKTRCRLLVNASFADTVDTAVRRKS